jgi:D-lactate dehydrogenase
MALIYFYDATELDKQQLTESLRGTDHRWQFIDGKIEPENCDPETEVIAPFVSSTITRAIIEKLPKLKLIACRSTGFNNIDLDAAKEHGVTVVNVPTYGENTVAEYAFMLLLALVRKLPDVLRTENEQYVPEKLMGHDLQGRTFGVIGTGHIGQKSLQIARGFAMNTIAYDAFPKKELEAPYGFTYVELDDLLARSDIVSLHTPYLPSTKHIINRDRLGRMKQGSILINTARGELVDTTALVDALASGHLGGAAIDVVEGETLLNYHEEMALLRSNALPEEVLRRSVEISVLKKMPNVLISPHNAFNTVEAILRINQTTAQNIIDFWYGKMPNKVEASKKTMGTLLVVRHTESEWNAVGKWTGVTDVHLSDKGFREAAQLGQALKGLDIKVDAAYCSKQIRTRETLESMLDAAQEFNVAIEQNAALNERDYGVYTAKNKWEIKDSVGETAFNELRRGWDVPVQDGETLKMVYERVVPFYKDTVLPLLAQGKNVMLVAHGNSIRALMKYIESISDQGISNLEMPFCQIMVYMVSPEGLKVSSSCVAIDAKTTHA